MNFTNDLEMARFLWPSLVTAGAVTIAAAPAGAVVVLRRDSLLALALPQVVAVGLACGLRFGLAPWMPAIAAVASALALVAWARQRHRADPLLPALYIACLAGSILLIVHSAQHLAELQNLFTGMDVAVSPAEAAVAVPVLLLLALPVVLLWRRWLLLAQAPATAQVAGMRPARWHLLFLSLLSAIVLVATDMQGTVLVVAMLFLPALAALPWARRLPGLMVLSVLCGMASLVVGFELSARQEWPLSHSIAAAGAMIACITHGLRGMVKVYGTLRSRRAR